MPETVTPVTTEACVERYESQDVTGRFVSEATWRDHYQGTLPERADPWWVHRAAPDTVGANAWAILLVEETLPYFAGHFPHNPILPGIAQLNWCAQIIADLLDRPMGNFHGYQRVKFRAPIHPGAIVKLELSNRPGGVSCALRCPDQVLTQAVLTYVD